MVLGFGCDTMATMVTKTLETKRERVISTMLLALAIPCSAQLGIIFGLLVITPGYVVIWVLSVVAVFLFVGFLAARVMPGERPYFYMEMPPLRFPKVSNVVVKTFSRVHWYFLEVLPVFVAASVLIWLGQLTGLFDVLVEAMTVPTTAIGLPADAAVAFLFGFFRRDYGAAGLYHLNQSGLMTGPSLLVSAVTLTLFMPCIAQFLVMTKQRGLKTALGMALFIFPFAFVVGFVLNSLLTVVGI
jgi:ferrous iron transport protein B